MISVGSEVQVLPGPFLRALCGEIPRRVTKPVTAQAASRGTAAAGGSSCPVSCWFGYGGIAQLVEHLLCKQGVTGSNPVASMSAQGGLATGCEILSWLPLGAGQSCVLPKPPPGGPLGAGRVDCSFDICRWNGWLVDWVSVCCGAGLVLGFCMWGAVWSCVRAWDWVGGEREGRSVDALAPRGDEGRGTLRKAAGRCERSLIRGYPNGETPPVWRSWAEYIGLRGEPGELKHLSTWRKRHQRRFRE